MRRLGLIACLILAGCGGRYRAFDSLRLNGYQSRMLAGGNTLVSYTDPDPVFAKTAAWRRVAELGLELGYGYAVVKSEQTLSSFEPRSDPNGIMDQSLRSAGSEERGAGLQRKESIGYSYMVEYFKKRPESGLAVELSTVLRESKVPGAEAAKNVLEQDHAK